MKPYQIPYLHPVKIQPGPTASQIGHALSKLIATARKNTQNQKP